MRPRTLTLFAIVSMLLLASIAQAADNQVGTWKLNAAKSKFSLGPARKDGTLTVESEPNELKITIHSTDPESNPFTWSSARNTMGRTVPRQDYRGPTPSV